MKRSIFLALIVSGWAAMVSGHAAHADTIPVTHGNVAATASTCTLAQAIYAANLANNLANATPPGASTIAPLSQSATTTVGIGSCSGASSGANTIDLAAIAGETLSFASDDNYWYGPNALPPIASDITIKGRGAILEIPAGTLRRRFFFIGADSAGSRTPGYNTPGAGALTLRELHLRGGRQRGGNSRWGGGGAGLGGAIYNQGALALHRVTFSDNTARGGDSGDTGRGLAAGGLGADGGVLGNVAIGGGMGGSVPLGAGDPGGNMGSVTAGNGGGVDSGLAGAGGDGARGGHGGGGGGAGNENFTGSSGAGGGGFGGGGGGGSPGTVKSGGAFGAGGANAGDQGGGGGGGVGGGGGGATVIGTATRGGGGGGFGGGGGTGATGGAASAGGDGGFGGGSGSGTRGNNPAPGRPGFAAGSGGRSDSTSTSGGGGGAGLGGAIFNHFGTLALREVTFHANAAQGGQALAPANGSMSGHGYGGALFNLNGEVVIDHATFAGNDAEAGGALYSIGYNGHLDAGSTHAGVTITRSLFAGNGPGGDLSNDLPGLSNAQPNLATEILTVNDSLIQNPSGALVPIGSSTGNLLGVDPQLGPLTDNGGLSDTRLPAYGSPAIDAVACAWPDAGVDQRGIVRPQGARCDIGAVEVVPLPDAMFADGFE